MNLYNNIVYIEELWSINSLLKGKLEIIEDGVILVNDLKMLELFKFKNCKFIFYNKKPILNLNITDIFLESIHFICLIYPQNDLEIEEFWQYGECYKFNSLRRMYNAILEGVYSIYIPDIFVYTDNIKVQDMGFNEFFSKKNTQKPKLSINGKNVIIYNQERYKKE